MTTRLKETDELDDRKRTDSLRDGNTEPNSSNSEDYLILMNQTFLLFMQ